MFEGWTTAIRSSCNLPEPLCCGPIVPFHLHQQGAMGVQTAMFSPTALVMLPQIDSLWHAVLPTAPSERSALPQCHCLAIAELPCRGCLPLKSSLLIAHSAYDPSTIGDPTSIGMLHWQRWISQVTRQGQSIRFMPGSQHRYMDYVHQTTRCRDLAVMKEIKDKSTACNAGHQGAE